MIVVVLVTRRTTLNSKRTDESYHPAKSPHRVSVDDLANCRVNVENSKKKPWETLYHTATTLYHEWKRGANRCYGRLIQTSVIIYL